MKLLIDNELNLQVGYVDLDLLKECSVYHRVKDSVIKIPAQKIALDEEDMNRLLLYCFDMLLFEYAYLCDSYLTLQVVQIKEGYTLTPPPYDEK
jgi:hypothetical protein